MLVSNGQPRYHSYISVPSKLYFLSANTSSNRNLPKQLVIMKTFSATSLAALLCTSTAATQITYTIPTTPPIGSAKLDGAPVALSFEFTAFPNYFVNISNTRSCLSNFRDLTGVWPRIRIGGTSEYVTVSMVDCQILSLRIF